MKRIALYILILASHLCINAQEVITLDLKAAVDKGLYEFDADKGHWTETYNPQENILSFNNGMFNFSHIPGLFGGSDVGGGMSYWDGFTICSSGDTTDYGLMSSSDGWVAEQWGCMAGGGLNENMEVEEGYPYLVAYWGYYYETEEIHACRVDFDGKSHKAKGVYICNHPWPYYGNIHGDGFASAFTEPGSYFTITAHGLFNGEDTGSEVTMTLAENIDDGEQHGEDWPEGLVQSNEWQWMDLEDLGNVDGIYFTMESTDADPLYGPNTAVYFCLDRLQIYEHENTELPMRPNNLSTSDIAENTATLHWADNNDTDTWFVYLNDSLVGETTDTLYCYTNLNAYTEYTLKVIAQNNIGTSDPASITIKTLDLTAPTVPTDLVAKVLDPYSIQLNWTASTDNISVYRYRIYVNELLEARPKTNYYTLTGLDPDTEYTITIDAIDASDNVSPKATIVARTERILPPLPTQPQGLNATNIDETEITIEWQGDDNAESWSISVNDSLIATTKEPLYTIGDLRPFTEYTISIVAQNEAGNSPASILQATTIDVTAPAAPTNLMADNSTAYTLVFSWAPSEDNDSVASYNIYLDNELIATIDSCTYTIADLESDQEFTLAVEAIDRADNISARSEVSVRTSDDDPLAISGPISQSQRATIFSLQGKLIKTHNINDLPPGIYIINNKKIRLK